jgi:hypothetical protein
MVVFVLLGMSMRISSLLRAVRVLILMLGMLAGLLDGAQLSGDHAKESYALDDDLITGLEVLGPHVDRRPGAVCDLVIDALVPAVS